MQTILLFLGVGLIAYCIYKLFKIMTEIPEGGGFFNEENDLP